MLGDGPESPVAVMLEAARPAEMAPPMVDAYGFTDSERRVAEMVAQGLSTRQIARLFFDQHAASLTPGAAEHS